MIRDTSAALLAEAVEFCIVLILAVIVALLAAAGCIALVSLVPAPPPTA